MIRIVAINSKYVHTLLSPYYLKANCFYNEIDILQTNINQKIDDIVNSAISDNPIAIALPTYIFNVDTVEKAAISIKEKLPMCKIILGGPEVSFEYENRYPYADYIITGEGEEAFNNVVKAILNNDKSERIVIGKTMDLSRLNAPYTEDYFRDIKGKIAYFESSRGCPFRCAYCMSGDSILRYFDIEYIKENLLKFSESGARVVKFVDRTFNANKTMSKKIMRFIIQNKEKWQFGFHFEIAADILDDEFIEIVGSSSKGLFQFEIGVQSFNEETLSEVIRKSDIDKVTDNIKRLIATDKSHIHTDLIAGLPKENLESFIKGFDRLYNLGSDMLQLGFLKVLKGSRLKNEIGDDYIYSDNAPYEIISTPDMRYEEIQELKTVEEALHRYYNSRLFELTLKNIVIEKPYEFYLALGKVSPVGKDIFISYETLYNFLVERFGYDSDYIKDLLTIDYVTKNNSRILPPILKRPFDKNFAKLLRENGIDKKKVFALSTNLNPFGLIKEKGIITIDYSVVPYKIDFIRT